MKLILFLLVLSTLAITSASPPPDNLEEFIRGAEKHKAETGEDLDENELQRQFEQFQAQQMMGGGGNERRFAREIPAIEPDVPYVQCQTCELLVDQVSQRVAARRAKYPKTKLTEMQILEMLTDDGGICDPVQGTGQWLAEYDIKTSNGALQVEHQVGQVGHCEEECKTLALACENVLHAQDSEIAELAYLNKLDAKQVCYDQLAPLPGRCGDELAALPQEREEFEFKPKSEMDIALAEASRELRHQQQLNPDMFRDDL